MGASNRLRPMLPYPLRRLFACALLTHASSFRVIGCLMGMTKGRDVEIFNSFELVYELKDGKVEIDQEFLTAKKGNFASLFVI